ncbi:MAG TPA: DUF4149 domain-containing protein [Albitalea sp.]|uniref:DUF4149 domain-containing protein n=1 Tax=Piscinibacter sp. TaxID=1903157 RepID=UPI002ED2494F
MTARRVAAWLAGLWAGWLWALALTAAPAAFAVATPEVAGRMAGRMFAQEAYAAILVSVVLFMLLRRQARAAAAAGTGSVFSADMVLVLGALFCTVAGYFALQPMMAAARAGQGSVSFAALHGASMALYGLKALQVAALAWRLAAR